jgi:hypothetical protein
MTKISEHYTNVAAHNRLVNAYQYEVTMMYTAADPPDHQSVHHLLI